MGIEIARFGVTDKGENIDRIVLKNDDGSYVALLNYGASLQSILVPDRTNSLTDVCLGYGSLSEYQKHGDYFGATIGRCANRISKGTFSLGKEEFNLTLNEGANHLHGGQFGFDKRTFSYLVKNDGICFLYDSPHGEEGYPGTLHVKVFYVFTPQHQLEITCQASCQVDTIVNLTNHAYFNLDGEGSGSILDHFLQIFSDRFLKINEESLPAGGISPTRDTPFDFQAEKRISEDIHKDDEQLLCGHGYDHYYFLEDKAGLKKCATLRSEKTGIKMTVHTTKPGVQLYTGNGMKTSYGKTGTYRKRSGVCLETQYPPDAINLPDLAHYPILPANHVYYHKTIYSFSTEAEV